ncbi:hypothetical protein Q3G72_034570 [Acer saccharum]|nr:hypothetical protein Q3G72_034570 [Acer saccharum]
MANKNTSIYKIFWFISCSLWASHVAAVDVLNQGDVLNSSASLVSRNELFTLRFFNLSSNGDYNTNYSYLGIFYRYNTNPGKPFWLANRDMPITDNSGALVIDETGKLIITFNGGKAPLELFSSRSNNKLDYYGLMFDQISRRVVLSPDWCDGNSTSSGCKRWEGPKCRSRGENFWKEYMLIF